MKKKVLLFAVGLLGSAYAGDVESDLLQEGSSQEIPLEEESALLDQVVEELVLRSVSQSELTFEDPTNCALMRVLSLRIKRKRKRAIETALAVVKVAVAAQEAVDGYEASNGEGEQNFLSQVKALVPDFMPFLELLSLADGVVKESLEKHAVELASSELYKLRQENDKSAFLNDLFADVVRTQNFLKEVAAVRRCFLANLHPLAQQRLEEKVKEVLPNFEFSAYI